MWSRVGLAIAAASMAVGVAAIPAGAAASGEQGQAGSSQQAAEIFATHMARGSYSALSAGGTVSLNDPVGDVTDPRADITHVSASYTAQALTLTATLKHGTDPRTDPLWQSNDPNASRASLEFAIETSPFSFFPDYIGTISGGPHNTLLASFANTGNLGGSGSITIIDGNFAFGPGSQCGSVRAAYNAGTYTFSVASNCIENIPVAHIAVGMFIYPPFNSPFPINQQPIYDVAPDNGTVALRGVPGGDLLAAGDGGVFAVSAAPFHGSLGSIIPAAPISGIAATPGLHGYWMVGQDGGVYSFGNAAFFGSAAGAAPGDPFVGIAASPTGHGYTLLTAAGRVFAFGDARWHGDVPVVAGAHAVAIAATPSGHGYWIAASDGSAYALGDARFFGSAFTFRPNQPIVAIVPTRTGDGYWLVAADGGVFTFGRARFFGSLGGVRLNAAIVGAIVSSGGGGYTMVGSDGGLFTFGDARWFGPSGFFGLRQPIVGLVAE